MDVKVLEIALGRTGVLEPHDLPRLGALVHNAVSDMGWWDETIGVSGRLPRWAYAFLAEVLAPAAAIATYEPANDVFIVASRRSLHAPPLGTLIPRTDTEETVLVEVNGR
jgi:hypothetical protein